jgi:hypothetical protein
VAILSLQKTFDACQEISASPEEHYYFLLTLTEAVGSSDQFQNPPAWPLNAVLHLSLCVVQNEKSTSSDPLV